MPFILCLADWIVKWWITILVKTSGIGLLGKKEQKHNQKSIYSSTSSCSYGASSISVLHRVNTLKITAWGIPRSWTYQRVGAPPSSVVVMESQALNVYFYQNDDCVEGFRPPIKVDMRVRVSEFQVPTEWRFSYGQDRLTIWFPNRLTPSLPNKRNEVFLHKNVTWLREEEVGIFEQAENRAGRLGRDISIITNDDVQRTDPATILADLWRQFPGAPGSEGGYWRGNGEGRGWRRKTTE